MEASPQPNLVVAKGGEREEVAIARQGVTIGRSGRCDIVLKDRMVSKIHARLYQDPLERWIVEDMDSRNGTWVGHRRVQAHAVLPGDVIRIRPFSLSLAPLSDQEISADPTITESAAVRGNDASTETTPGRGHAETRLSRDRFAQLNTIIERLAELGAPAQLYPEACGCLARTLDALTMVVRLPKEPRALSGPPQILACCSGSDEAILTPHEAATYHVSYRTIESVRSNGKAVAASGFRHSEGGCQLSLTNVDGDRPRSVFCSPIAEGTDSLDVLYLDVPLSKPAPDTLDFVQAAAKQVSLARKSLLLAEARAERRTLDHQLRLAQKIQLRLAPRDLMAIEGIDLALEYRPAMWVGGDYCDAWTLSDGRLVFAVGDVCGKGLPAALLMASLQAALRSTMAFCSELTKVASHVNQLLRQNAPEGMFVTLFLGLFDPGPRELEYINAGHIPPVMFAAGKTVSSFSRPGSMPLGILDGPFATERRTLEPGEGLLVVTDGVTESRSPSGRAFGTEGLHSLLAEKHPASAAELVRLVGGAVDAHRQDLAQQDDLTVFAMMIRV